MIEESGAVAGGPAVEACLGLTTSQATDRVLRRARAYVEIETPSRDEAALRRLADRVRADLEDCGATVESIDAPGLGANLLARLDTANEPGPPLLVLAHMDTVHAVGTLAARPFRIEGDRAYGPGIYDMKAGLATVIEALAWQRERGAPPRRPVELLITCDEEIGSHSVREMIRERAAAAAAVLVPEPCLPDGGAKTFRKGVATYRIEATGRAAHAGIEGASAVSAITELVHALAAALDLADHARGTTINIGQIGGGTASNVVAAEAWAAVDVRLAEPGEGERIAAAFAGMRPRREGAGLRAGLQEDRPPLVRTPAVAALYERARELAASLGAALAEGGSGGGSDGSIAAATGTATLDGLGPQGGGAHADDEHILLSDLPFRLALMSLLLARL
jgi:glutamate carboxypeptidase